MRETKAAYYLYATYRGSKGGMSAGAWAPNRRVYEVEGNKAEIPQRSSIEGQLAPIFVVTLGLASDGDDTLLSRIIMLSSF